jgi:hypothetical protein
MWAIKLRVDCLAFAGTGRGTLLVRGRYLSLEGEEAGVALVLEQRMKGRLGLPLGWCEAKAGDPGRGPLPLGEEQYRKVWAPGGPLLRAADLLPACLAG